MKRNPEEDTQPIPTKLLQARLAPRRPHGCPVRIDAAGMSHRGSVRDNNEDNFLVARVGRSLDTLAASLPDGEAPHRFDETGYMLMVADGMGGAAAGEVASRVAIRTLVNIILDVPDWIMRLDDDNVEEIMVRAASYYREVDSALALQAQKDPDLLGMGTTMTVAYSVGRDLFVAHVGDSRAYLHRGGRLEQLTRDHTHVQDLVDAGMISREEAATHRLRNVLTNVLGGSERSVDVEMHRLELNDADRLLLCSDGLPEVVDDHEVAEVLERMKGPEVACRSLIDLALERGAPDNVTVVAARFSIH